MTKPISVVHVRDIDYATCFSWQNTLHEQRVADLVGDVLLCVTHPPVYTAGRHAEVQKNLTGTRPDIPVVPIDRGGDLTYHGPGQVVAYPIIKLGMRGAAKAHVGALETAMINTCANYGVQAGLRENYPGVWVQKNKIGAVGVRIAKGVSKHGLAFNVNPDLADYTGIIPCGITDGGVTTLAKEVARLNPNGSASHDMSPLSVDTAQQTVASDEPNEQGTAGFGRDNLAAVGLDFEQIAADIVTHLCDALNKTPVEATLKTIGIS